METLKEFRNILLGQKIVVHTDHKNLTCKNFNTERVMRWRLILEEYGPELRYIKGENNIVADALSRLGMLSENGNDDDGPETTEDMAQLFAADENDFPAHYPLSYAEIQQRQNDDADVQKLLQEADGYEKTSFSFSSDDYELVTKDGRIVLPKALQKKGVEWYHGVLMHPGETRTELTMAQHFTWKGMRRTVQSVCRRCESCQLNKPKTTKVGHLPEKTAEAIPWHTLCIDLIGPYTIGNEKRKDDVATLHCLTMIDPATGWFEIVEIPAKTADVVINILESAWLVRYPRPTEVVMDRGVEFMGEVRHALKHEYGLKLRFITTRNPQANSMVERAHKTIGNMIRSQNLKSRHDLPDGSWAGVLNAVGFAMKATLHTTMRATPMQLVFGRDAIHNVTFEADWQYIKERRQRLIRQNNERENAARVPHNYQPEDKVMVAQPQPRKFGQPRFKGPYTVDRVFNDNGTVRLRVPKGNGYVYETWNIRNTHPYKA